MGNGIAGLRGYQNGGVMPPDPEEGRRRQLLKLMAEQRNAPTSTRSVRRESLAGLPSLRPDPDPPTNYVEQEFNINEDRMETLLDTLNALGGGNTSFVRQARGRSADFPTGLYRATKEQAPLPHWYSQLRNPLGGNRVREGLPPQINLTAAGDYASRRAGEGFEMDSSGRPMTGEWSRPERFVAMHEAGHGMDVNDILPESLEIMQKESNAPMYPWQDMGEPSWPERVWEELDRKWAGTYETEKFATQVAKAVEILQDSLDPERRGEAVSRIDSPEMKELVEKLLENPVYKSHPLRLP